MPVLEWEPPLWPDNLLEEEFVAERPEPGRWWALHVRPRAEKMLARRLRVRRVAYYLPVHERRKAYPRRVVTSRVPLFPGYLFAYGDDADYEFLQTSREVVNALQVVEQESLLKELRSIRRLVGSGAPITAEERLEAGMPARIIKGPLAGMYGQVVQNKRGLRFVLQVQFIQRAASIEVDGTMVEAV